MEGSGSGGWFLSGSKGRLSDMEMPLPKRQENQTGQQPLMTHQTHHFPPLDMVSALEKEQPTLGFGEAKELTLGGGMSLDFGKGKGISLGPSCSNNSTSEDEDVCLTDDVNKKRKLRWQRMKWTDDVIRLLIAVVASVGDDAVHDAVEKRKFGVSCKKGKWKMVSNVMISKGWCVSPQQCEDKFNDLNKRYKKLNDILGRGTSCQVVENPSLMDSMPHLTKNAKDEVTKILSSKHLFYREMCAYHNGQLIPGCPDVDLQGHVSALAPHSIGNNLSEEREVEKIDDSESDDDSYGHNVEARKTSTFSAKGGLNDLPKSPVEQIGWIKQQLQKSEEETVRLQGEALDLEEQRFKWLRFRSKKDRELEMLRLENEKMKLENDGLALLLKQKALQLQAPRLVLGSETTAKRTSFSCHGVQGRDELNLNRHL